MADPAPLLTTTVDSSELNHPIKHEKPVSTLDETIQRCIGDFGWAQFFQAFLVSLAWVFDAQQTFISIFTDVDPSWHCTPSGVEAESCSTTSDICQLSRSSWAWDKPIEASIISEWALQCDGSIISGLPASSFFMGCLVGGIILATLADTSLGRKNMLLISCLMMSISSVFTIFSNNIWVYSAFRFVCGFGRATIGTSALVLSTELVGKKWRAQVGAVGFSCFTLGFLSLPGIAYLNRTTSSWRSLYLWTSVPTLFYCILVHFFVRESPRWLLVRGRKEEAVTILKTMATDEKNKNSSFSGLSLQQETWNANVYSSIKMLVTKKWTSRRLFAVMTAGFGIGMVYYGMPLALGNLDVNLYLSVTLNALSELPASLVTFLLIKSMGRKTGLLAFAMTSGLAMLALIVTTNPTIQYALNLLSFFCACTAFNILLIYTTELFPTSVRNSALAMVRQALVLGGAFGPSIVAAGRKSKNGILLTYGVFGTVIGLCGLFVVFLPETSGGTMCDTLDEEELKHEISDQIVICS